MRVYKVVLHTELGEITVRVDADIDLEVLLRMLKGGECSERVKVQTPGLETSSVFDVVRGVLDGDLSPEDVEALGVKESVKGLVRLLAGMKVYVRREVTSTTGNPHIYVFGKAGDGYLYVHASRGLYQYHHCQAGDPDCLKALISRLKTAISDPKSTRTLGGVEGEGAVRDVIEEAEKVLRLEAKYRPVEPRDRSRWTETLKQERQTLRDTIG